MRLSRLGFLHHTQILDILATKDDEFIHIRCRRHESFPCLPLSSLCAKASNMLQGDGGVGRIERVERALIAQVLIGDEGDAGADVGNTRGMGRLSGR